ncbi:MAG: lipoyl synthase, partial [Tannerellaceae bacterium]
CKFCNTKTGKPLPLNPNEPLTLAETVKTMQLKHAVITSVDRDDLPDLGARHWVDTICEIRKANPETTIEVLIPDFQGKADLIQQVIDAKPNVISHNMETVKRLSPLIRSAARYEISLAVIKQIADSGIVAKSGIMLGLGETQEEVEEVMDDLLSVGCSVLTIGQYLQPSRKNIEVYEYITLEKFSSLQQIAQEKGFKLVESGPLVRSSYHAEKHVAPLNLYV